MNYNMKKRKEVKHMLNKEVIQTLLTDALKTGADFAEFFFEDTNNQTIRVTSGDVTNVGFHNTHGVGVRLIQNGQVVYGYLNDVTEDSLKALVEQLSASFNGKPQEALQLGNPKPFKYDILKPMKDIKTEEKAATLIELSNLIKQYDARIVQAITMLNETEQHILIANSKGIYQDDIRTYSRVILMAVASENGNMQQVFEGPGRHMGFEIFDVIDMKALALDVAQRAINMLSAKDMVPQELPVILHKGWGGVIFHEACGHPLEATAVAKGLSPFVGKIGEKVGSDVVTAYDDGDMDGAWGRTNFDDEGMKTQKNVLIENGILKSYLVDDKNSYKMNHAKTGSGRRQNYKYAPTSRMNTTYIAPGKDDYEDIIKDTKYGLFAKQLGGGTVVPATGEFNFAVTEGYMIENGKLTTPVRGAMLIGKGDEVLFKIDRVANNLDFGQGMCGSLSGSVPVDVGQPTLRVSKMTVGGSGKHE
jgi:TldD protein